MTRSKVSTKVVLLTSGIGLSIAAFAGSQPAAAQSYSYTCPDGFTYDATYGCIEPGADDYAYYGYYPYGTYGLYYGGHREFGHGYDHGISHADHGIGVAHFGGGGFGHGGGGGHR